MFPQVQMWFLYTVFYVCTFWILENSFVACSQPESWMFAFDLKDAVIVYVVLQIQRLRQLTHMLQSPWPHKMAHHLSAFWGHIQTVTAMTAHEKKMTSVTYTQLIEWCRKEYNIHSYNAVHKSEATANQFVALSIKRRLIVSQYIGGCSSAGTVLSVKSSATSLDPLKIDLRI